MEIDRVQEPLRLRLEIRRGSDPIEGLLREACGDGRAFRGWLELTAALEAALATRSPGTDSEERPR
jgi:hypothetical protein